jgi:hypothetical protein
VGNVAAMNAASAAAAAAANLRDRRLASMSQFQQMQAHHHGGAYSFQQIHHHPMQQHQQHLHSMQSMGMGMNMGLSMNMNDMESSLRGYHPMQQATHPSLGQVPVSSPPSTDGTPVPFWRPNSGVVGVDNSYKHGIELELPAEMNDILNGSNGGSTNTPHNDVSMSSVLSQSFEVGSYPENLNISVGGSRVGMIPSMQHRGNTSAVSGLQINHSRTNNGSGNRTGPNSNTTGTTSSNNSNSNTNNNQEVDYSRFVDSREEPDLSQEKLDEKNEKCQFHNCPNRARVLQAYGKFCNRHVIVSPCGFPGCRDKAMTNSSMCEKHLSQGKDALHKILASRAQNVPVCRTFGCFKNDQGRGYCRGHEKLLMATGRLPKHVNKRRLNSAYTMCSYPECNKHSQRNHLCRTHGNMILKQAEEIAQHSTKETLEEILTRLQKEIRRCTHPNCTKNSQRDRLCTMHYYEKHNIQRDGTSGTSDSNPPESPHSLMSSNSTPTAVSLSNQKLLEESNMGGCCDIPECNLAVFTRGMCKFHSQKMAATSVASPVTVSSPAAMMAMASSSSSSSSSNNGLNKCSVLGCTGNVYASGLCPHHFKTSQHQQQMQSQLLQNSSIRPNMLTCQVATCNTVSSINSTFCEQHRRMLAANGAGNTRGEQQFQLGGVSSSMSSSSTTPMIYYSPSVSPSSSVPMLASHIHNDVSPSHMQPQQYSNTMPGTIGSTSSMSEVASNNFSSTTFATFSYQNNSHNPRAIAVYDHQLDEDEAQQALTNIMGNTSNKQHIIKGEEPQAEPRVENSSNNSTSSNLFNQNTSSKDSKYSCCRFPGCSTSVYSGIAALCKAHIGATLCWSAKCDQVVEKPQFCHAHVTSNKCAFGNCESTRLDAQSPSCIEHSNYQKCHHARCDKFALENTKTCFFHDIKVHVTSSCSLCQLDQKKETQIQSLPTKNIENLDSNVSICI